MSIEDAIVYKKYFSGLSEGSLPEAFKEWENQQRSYDHAELLFVKLLMNLGELPGTEVLTSKESGRTFASVSVDDYKIVSAELGCPVPKKDRPAGLRELYVLVDRESVLEVGGLIQLPEIMKRIEDTLVYAGSSNRGDLETLHQDYFKN